MADADPEDMHKVWEFAESRKGKSKAVRMVVLRRFAKRAETYRRLATE